MANPSPPISPRSDKTTVAGKQGALHSYGNFEISHYVQLINSWFQDDQVLSKQLPLKENADDLFNCLRGGIALCKMINIAVPDTIDERALNYSAQTPWEVNHNCNLCINSAKAIGCTVVNIGADDIANGREHLVLGLVWQIEKIALLSRINVKNVPELIVLQRSDESSSEFSRLSAEEKLLRWVNYHLSNNGCREQAIGLGTDLQDGRLLIYLLNKMYPEKCDLSGLNFDSDYDRVSKVLCDATSLGCEHKVSTEGILSGNPRMGLRLVASLFNLNPAMEIPPDINTTELIDDDNVLHDTREARAFRLWLNSLNLSSPCKSITEDLGDGFLLLEVLDRIKPGCVEWKSVTKPPVKVNFKRIENCLQVIAVCKSIGFSTVGIGPEDIMEGKRNFLLGILWQMVRASTLKTLQNLRGSRDSEFGENDILAWMNDTLQAHGSEKVSSFKDLRLSSAVPLLKLLYAIEPKRVNWAIIHEHPTDNEQKELNAKYVLSVARALGAYTFITFEDIVQVKPKLIMTLVASIMAQANSVQNKPYATSFVSYKTPNQKTTANSAEHAHSSPRKGKFQELVHERITMLTGGLQK